MLHMRDGSLSKDEMRVWGAVKDARTAHALETAMSSTWAHLCACEWALDHGRTGAVVCGSGLLHRALWSLDTGEKRVKSKE